MAENVRYGSVQEMIRDISDDETFNEEFEEQISKRRLVKALHAMRTTKGVSQSAIAEELDCSQSRVSKIENGEDADLSVAELMAYARAMDREVHIGFSKRGLTGLDRIRNHALAIHNELRRMAETDESIARGVVKTFNVVLFNQIKLLQIASTKLPCDPETGEAYLKIDMCVEEMDENYGDSTDTTTTQDMNPASVHE